MLIDDYYSSANGNLSFSREQASNFAKYIADDFNPLHDATAKRFCVPGDLLFSIILARYGISAHMECTFSGMVTEGVELILPEPSALLGIEDASGREYLRVARGGDNSADVNIIRNLSQQYVQFSGHSFPDILVPLLAQHNVMINPDRPMVMYQNMSIDLDRLDIAQPSLRSDHSELSVDGKRGMAHLAFKLLDGEQEVGRGKKQILLSGLREYDEEKMTAAVAEYQERKKIFLATAE